MPVLARITHCTPVVLAAIILCVVLAIGPSFAQALETRPAAEAQFRAWLAQTVWLDAQKQGVSSETFERSLAKVTLDWDLPELQPPGSATPDHQRQAEFLSPGRYFAESQLASLAKMGRDLLRQWAPTLDAIERRYEVPREIIVAIWGRESHFGRVTPQRQ